MILLTISFLAGVYIGQEYPNLPKIKNTLEKIRINFFSNNNE